MNEPNNPIDKYMQLVEQYFISIRYDIYSMSDLFGQHQLDLRALGLSDVDLALLERLRPLDDVGHVLAQLRRLVLARYLGHRHSHLLAFPVRVIELNNLVGWRIFQLIRLAVWHMYLN